MDCDFSHLRLGETVSIPGGASLVSAIRSRAADQPGIAFSIRCFRGMVMITRVNDMRGTRGKYAFGAMSIGESRFFQDQPLGGKAQPAIAARVYAQNHPEYTFAAKAENGGVRIWRIGPDFPKPTKRKTLDETSIRKRRKKYPFDTVEIGQPLSYQRNGGAAASALCALDAFRKSDSGLVFTTRERDGWLEIERIA